MNIDDYVYLLFLIFSICFGSFYRKIEDVEKKKKIGAFVGFIIVLAVSRLHVIHVFVTITINALIILYSHKEHCHLISFAFSFIYLIFFRTTAHFGIPYPPSHTNLVQMILTLKLVGLAFEMNSAYNSKKKKDDDVITNKDELAEIEMSDFKLNITDVFYYGFNYVGILTGPYYKYRTYYDHLYKPFNKYDDYKTATYRKIIPLIPIFSAIYIFTDAMWPIHYTQSSDFEERSFLYRYWYIWPIFLTFRMRIYIGLILSECVCSMAGLGVYPDFTKNRAGDGPTTNFGQLQRVCQNAEELKMLKYDYETVHNINPYGTEFYPTLREGMKNWNMTVQYWLANCIYKRFPNKKFRTAATMFVSGAWHGVYLGYYISVGMIPFGLIVEDIWGKLLLKDNSLLPKRVGYVIMWFLKMQFFSYSAVAFCLLEVGKIMHYYNSVYHWIVPVYILLFFVGTYLSKVQMNNKQGIKE